MYRTGSEAARPLADIARVKRVVQPVRGTGGSAIAAAA